MALRYLIQKEFIQMRRNVFLPKLILLFPVVIMCVIPWVTDLEVRNINVRVVDNDRSPSSERLVRRIEASSYFIFKGMSPSYGHAMKEVERGETDIVAVIPRHYGRGVAQGRPPRVLVAANAVNGTKGAMGSSYLASIVGRNASDETRAADAPQEKLSTLNLYNPRQDYKVFMIPALMAILVVMFCGFLPALNIVGEKESGTIEQMNVSPVGKTAFIAAKLVPYWLVAMLVLTVCFLLSWLVYGIVPKGSILLLYLLAMLLALTFSGIGLVISNSSDTIQQAMFVMWFILVCMILLSGLFTPVRSMPDWAIAITAIDPLRYFIDAMRTVFVRGGTLQAIRPQLAALAIFAVITNVLAVRSYKKNK